MKQPPMAALMEAPTSHPPPPHPMATTEGCTLKRKLSSSAPELQTLVCRKQSFTVDGTGTGNRMMAMDSSSNDNNNNNITSLDNGKGGCTYEKEEEEEDMNGRRGILTNGNTMETDDSSGMNQQQQQQQQPPQIQLEQLRQRPLLAFRQNLSGRINDSMEYKNSNPREELVSGKSATSTATAYAASTTNENIDRKTTNRPTNGDNKTVKGQHGHGIKNSLPTINLTRGLLRRQTRSINSILAIKMRTLFLIIINLIPLVALMVALLLLPVVPIVQAGFWTFYFPNFLKPSGYSELTGMIEKVERDMNETIDAFNDIQYFWGLMEEMDKVEESELYPEESACADVFPLFRTLAIEYSHIDYEHFMKPMESYANLLIEHRDEWYPEGPKSKTILPREWEQNLYETDLTMKIFWLSKLTNDPNYRQKREQMVNIWKSVKRNLDSSLPCIYLRYSYRQMAEDINQLALDSNLARMKEAEAMVQAAYKRIDKFSDSDEEAKKDIAEAIQKEERFNI